MNVINIGDIDLDGYEGESYIHTCTSTYMSPVLYSRTIVANVSEVSSFWGC